MALDRLITIAIERPGSRNDYGEFVPGTPHTRRAWATRKDVDLEKTIAEGGTRTEGRRNWRVRWYAELAQALPDAVTVSDEHAREWAVVGLVEVENQRRRFIDLEAEADLTSA